jgi:hypothetical protein
MVFVSKVLGPYTNMFLTHIDEKGNASIPVLVEKANKYEERAKHTINSTVFND